DAGAERLDHDVGAMRQVAGDVQVVSVVEVEHDALLAATPERERGLRAQWAATRWLDVHHVGSEVGEEAADVRAGERVRQVDDAQTVQRTAHVSPPRAEPASK